MMIGSESKPINIAFLGTGFARRVQMPAFLMAGGCRITSIASGRIENARTAAEEFEAEFFTDDWQAAIDHPGVELVCITTPPVQHCEQAIYAAARSKHILCEKPMAMNVPEAEAMCRAASDAGVLALIDHELRFQEGRRTARAMLAAGEIGAVRHVKYSFRNAMRGDPSVPWNWWSDESAGGGTLGAIGSHAIDSLLWFLGTDIESVACRLQTHVKTRLDATGRERPVTTDDEALLTIKFAKSGLCPDTTGIVSLSMIEYPDYEHSIEFVGTSGSIKVLFLGDVLITRAGESEWTRLDITIGESVPGIFDSGFPNAFVSFAPRVIEAIRNGRTSVDGAATFEDGLRVQRILDAARESDRSGLFVQPKSLK